MKKVTRFWKKNCIEIYGGSFMLFTILGFEWLALGAITLTTATMIRREWYEGNKNV